MRRGSTCTSTEGRGGTAVAKAGAGRGAEPIENERDAMRWQRVATKRTNLVRTYARFIHAFCGRGSLQFTVANSRMRLSVRLASPRRTAIAAVICLLCQQTKQVECFSGNSLNNGAAAATATAVLVGTHSKDEEVQLISALQSSGYARVLTEEDSHSMNGNDVFVYEVSRATGMLRLVSSPEGNSKKIEVPRWIPMIRGEEKVLVENGWSFLDPDESEPMSAFDVDAANAEGQYRPKWGGSDDAGGSNSLQLSSLGYDIGPLPRDTVLAEAETLVTCNENSKGVLLDGQTDPPGSKITSNGIDFRGSAGQADVPSGVFACAIGGLPLFASTDLSPMSGSSGWLTFTRPITLDHVTHIEPDKESRDQRVEVIDSRSKCHLGHYFGTDGYCINASALRFIPLESVGGGDDVPSASRPVSYRSLDDFENVNGSPSLNLLKALLNKTIHIRYESVALGAGCFWHVEFALRRLPGVFATETAYAGGSTQSPTYRDVCNGDTGHAEVVKVIFDPDVLPYNILLDCFLSIHDPTKVRSHGKHAEGIGQYRSCILCENPEIYQASLSALERCRQQLGKELSTDLQLIQKHTIDAPFGEGWCWKAEERHQRHDERLKTKQNEEELTTLSPTDWLTKYGRRRPSIVGSTETIPVGMDGHPDDDGMARLMI